MQFTVREKWLQIFSNIISFLFQKTLIIIQNWLLLNIYDILRLMPLILIVIERLIELTWLRNYLIFRILEKAFELWDPEFLSGHRSQVEADRDRGLGDRVASRIRRIGKSEVRDRFEKKEDEKEKLFRLHDESVNFNSLLKKLFYRVLSLWKGFGIIKTFGSI